MKPSRIETAHDSSGATRPAFLVGGVRIDAATLGQATSQILDATGSRAVHLCNAYTISLAARDSSLAERLNRGTWNFPDGMPLVWVARRLGFHHINDRVYGPDLMKACLDQGRALGVRHYLYGSTPEVLQSLQAQIEQRWPGVQIVGAESPAFDDSSDADLQAAVERFNETDAQLVWVGLGTPKQDVAVDRLVAIGSHTYIAIGAAFDFIAGSKRQAPLWMQRSGLEWLFRLVSEPKRMWKRYLVGNAVFLWTVLRHRPHVVV